MNVSLPLKERGARGGGGYFTTGNQKIILGGKKINEITDLIWSTVNGNTLHFCFKGDWEKSKLKYCKDIVTYKNFRDGKLGENSQRR